MASERVIRIMLSRGSPFTDEILDRMSDHECWKWIYDNPKKPKKPAPKPQPSRTVCFTGFRPAREEELSQIAASHGWRVIGEAGKTMSHLCTGDKPGPKKLEKARHQGAVILSESEFLKLLSGSVA